MGEEEEDESLWILNYTTVHDGKNMKLNLVELQEASQCMNRLLKKEIGAEETRGCLKQLRQHVDDLSTHLGPLHSQIKGSLLIPAHNTERSSLQIVSSTLPKLFLPAWLFFALERGAVHVERACSACNCNHGLG